jgi:hypothetical protein
MSRAIIGSDVAITVESVFSMNSAVAMIRGTRREWCMTGRDLASRDGLAKHIPRHGSPAGFTCL